MLLDCSETVVQTEMVCKKICNSASLQAKDGDHSVDLTE